MYKLYWAFDTASFGPHAVLEEAGLDYQLIPVDIAAGENRKRAYKTISPLGKVPVVELPDGQILYEATAIMLYLAEQHGLDDLMPPPGHPLRALFLRSLFYLSNNVQDTYKRFYHPQRFSTDPLDAPKVKAKSIDALMECWQPVDAHLSANGPFHLGSRFSLADIYMTMLVTWFRPMEQLLEAYPAIRACHEIVGQRPAIARCLKPPQNIDI
ncbi:glutathione S-transferase family protein [Pelagibius sp. Alg239-R121]|uniref:glutathione S-transferase family protein n=1 Tax=Pelagibius sp. Alg239-R121 TaxID=2993448 RepID=UPI0024A74334|nr:glutathione S-transferase family protein [Pelagibius sp. Alg239-R121]